MCTLPQTVRSPKVGTGSPVSDRVPDSWEMLRNVDKNMDKNVDKGVKIVKEDEKSLPLAFPWPSPSHDGVSTGTEYLVSHQIPCC